MDLWQQIFPAQATAKSVAVAAKVGKTYAATVIKDISDTGNLIDPDFLRIHQIQSRRKGDFLALEEEVYLLSLWAEDASRPLLDYVTNLKAEYAMRVSVLFLDKWFKTRFEFRGSLRKPNLIPLDKYKQENVTRFVEFRHLLDLLFDHRKYNSEIQLPRQEAPRQFRYCCEPGLRKSADRIYRQYSRQRRLSRLLQSHGSHHCRQFKTLARCLFYWARERRRNLLLGFHHQSTRGAFFST